MGRALASTLEEEGVTIAGVLVDGTTEAINDHQDGRVAD
jgi:hypothetical protein